MTNPARAATSALLAVMGTEARVTLDDEDEGAFGRREQAGPFSSRQLLDVPPLDRLDGHAHARDGLPLDGQLSPVT